MKKGLVHILVVSFAAFSCHSNDVIKQGTVSIVTGEITVPVKEDIKLPDLAFIPDISTLKPKGDSSPVRMVAYGGSFFAGSRNGGLYREGQLTSVPELIAHQMKLSSFITPVFSKAQGNGSGYLVYDKSATLPSWKIVNNQTAVASKNPLVLAPFDGPYVDNISSPEGPIRTSDSLSLYIRYPRQTEYFAYLYRFFDKRGALDEPFSAFVDNNHRKTHLVLRFDDMDFWIGQACYSRNLNANEVLHSGYFTAKRFFIIDNLNAGRKMVLYNIPDFMDFPFFHLYDVKRLVAKQNITGQVLTDSSLLIPCDRVKRAFSGDHIVLQDEDVLSANEVRGFRIIVSNILNTNTTALFAAQYNLPLVDLYGLYKTILAGKYFTEDGLLIDPAFPDGNFFSDDGIHPTAIGNAVIANETIKKINEAYLTKIPLINVTELAKKL